MNLLDAFDGAYVLSLPERTDRRREMERELRRADVGLRTGQLAEKLRFFPAIRPTEATPFPSIGIRGASLSHLAILRDAEARGLSRVLVLEDDAEFEPGFQARAAPLLAALARRAWGMVHLGHLGGPATPPGAEAGWFEFEGAITGAHCYGVSWAALRPLIALFEEQHRGVPGDDRRGPMPADGTLNVFRWLNPDFPRLLAVPSLVGQRSSRSDITPSRIDRVPALRPLVRIARAIRARRRR